jgi:methionyl-tRNA formyltransferase
VTAKIIFAGTPDFAIPSLRSLVESGHEIVAVLTQPDRPAGRGRKLRPSPVKDFATGHGLPLLQPLGLGDREVQNQIKACQPDLAVVVAYGLLLPEAVLNIPDGGCINVHASILPRWRGASPIQSAILAGDESTGVSIMRMARGLDTGPVFATVETPIETGECAAELHDRLAEAGARLLMTSLDGILDGSSVPRPQDVSGATYAGRIKKADARIDWNESAIEIDRQIRAYNSWPVADTILDGARVRCWRASPATGAPGGDALPGTVVEAGGQTLDIQTGHGVIRLTELQLSGGQRMSAADFVRGRELAGKVFGH